MYCRLRYRQTRIGKGVRFRAYSSQAMGEQV